eukprot:TRINITY_DN3645_c0_g1_i1.p1 TRINITY_DN3645_c0_g1~~TRINITY_DN3645_c0_g1_i1.p1  ORF type:complete len:1297 (-),score=168.77 TRINITY_DN3645_c0_g1_i1:82-3972(-)
MCRFMVYKGLQPVLLADLVTKPSHSIMDQSYHCKERRPGPGSSFNADGFGVGWYPLQCPGQFRQGGLCPIVKPCVFKSDKPAWSNDNLRSIASTISSDLIFAHVRAATPGHGSVSEANCHPYVNNQFMWMHNGGIGEFAQVRRRMITFLSDDLFQSLQGTTDAEAAFLVFLEHLKRRNAQQRGHASAGLPTSPTPRDLVEAMRETLRSIVAWCDEAGVTEQSILNFCVTDGQTVVATRFSHRTDDSASLYFSSGSKFSCHNGEYLMESTERKATVAIIASEPLTDNVSDWVRAPHNSFIVATPDASIMIFPVDADLEEVNHVLAPPSGSVVVSSRKNSGRSPLPPGPTLSIRTESDCVSPPLCSPQAPSASTTFSSVNYGGHCLGRQAWSSPPPASAIHSGHGMGPRKICGEEMRRCTPLQILTGHTRIILACSVLTATNRLFTCGQDSTVRVWDLETFQQLACRNIGRFSVLSMFLDDHRRLLYVAAADTRIHAFKLTDDIPPVFSVAGPGCKILTLRVLGSTLFCGGQDTRLYYTHADRLSRCGPAAPEWLSCSAHFGPIYATAHMFLRPASSPLATPVTSDHSRAAEWASTNRFESQNDAVFTLLTASGDGLIKAWSERPIRQRRNSAAGSFDSLEELSPKSTVQEQLFSCASSLPDGDVELHNSCTFSGHRAAVLCLAIGSALEEIFYSASADCTVRVWNAPHGACIHTLQHQHPLCGLHADSAILITATTAGIVQVWSRFPHTLHTTFDAATTQIGGDASTQKFTNLACSADFIITAHGDREDEESDLRVWDMASVANTIVAAHGHHGGGYAGSSHRSMVALLHSFVSFKSISSNPEHSRDCYNTAFFLKDLLERMIHSCEVRLVKTAPQFNPVVFARIPSSPPKSDAVTVVVYGHYDVVDTAGTDSQLWASNPFEMVGRDGYYYGRGVTDNKGPIMAVLHAVYEMIEESKQSGGEGLPVNLLMVFEGAQETDSGGIEEACRAVEGWIRPLRTEPSNAVLLVTNTYWLGDRVPCLVYGLRGILRLRLEVSGPSAELHSGIDGGIVREPMVDMVHLLSALTTPDGRVAVNGFYDNVAQVSEDHEKLFDALAKDFSVDDYKSSRGVSQLQLTEMDREKQTAKAVLKQRWCSPSFTIHGIHSACCPSLIPSCITADVSVRTVPNQDNGTIAQLLTSHLQNVFQQLNSGNQLSVTVERNVKWWQGDVHSRYYAAAEKALRQVWQQDPLYIQEGGSLYLPLLAVLPQLPVLHLPLGQASDHAHLPNERIRWENLVKGKRVLKSFFKNLVAQNLSSG